MKGFIYKHAAMILLVFLTVLGEIRPDKNCNNAHGQNVIISDDATWQDCVNICKTKTTNDPNAESAFMQQLPCEGVCNKCFNLSRVIRMIV